MRIWNRSHHGAWHLYGHSHSKLPAAEGSQSMDVGVDTNAFHPYHLDEIRTRLALHRCTARGLVSEPPKAHQLASDTAAPLGLRLLTRPISFPTFQPKRPN